MPFSEKAALRTVKDERRPLLRDPIWTYNHRYGSGGGRTYDSVEMEELLGLEGARNQRFHWILFLSVTFLSILLLLATMGVLIQLSQTHPSTAHKPNSTTTPIPFKVSQSQSPTTPSFTTPLTSTLETSSTTTTTEAIPAPPGNVNGSTVV